MIGIIDYGLGNIKAFCNIYNALGVNYIVARQESDLAGVSHVILPGVGAFDQAMQRLNDSGMRRRLDSLVLERKLPVLGICVGMQILAETSEEGVSRGLGWLSAAVRKFQFGSGATGLRVPHMGWNDVVPVKPLALFAGLEERARFYFLHSYYMSCHEAGDVIASTDYGGGFACAVGRGNVFGVQFHPEKSHSFGIRLLQNFANS